MHGDEAHPTPEPNDAGAPGLDPDRLRDAHGRTGRMLKNAGLPFEEEEFDDADADETSTSSDDSSDT